MPQRATGSACHFRATPGHLFPATWRFSVTLGHRETAFIQRVVCARSRGRSSEAEHQLPKLRTRVRFSSPALDEPPGQAHSIAVTPRRVRGIVVPFRAIRDLYEAPSGLDLIERTKGACHCRAIGHRGSCPNHAQEPWPHVVRIDGAFRSPLTRTSSPAIVVVCLVRFAAHGPRPRKPSNAWSSKRGQACMAADGPPSEICWISSSHRRRSDLLPVRIGGASSTVT